VLGVIGFNFNLELSSTISTNSVQMISTIVWVGLHESTLLLGHKF
jgi:hypothetical protein